MECLIMGVVWLVVSVFLEMRLVLVDITKCRLMQAILMECAIIASAWRVVGAAAKMRLKPPAASEWRQILAMFVRS
jgi:hypothetical protein